MLGAGLIGLLVTVRLASLVVQALNDLFVTRTVEGEVLRERTWGNGREHHPLGGGRQRQVTSGPSLAGECTGHRTTEVDQNQVVRVQVTPLLGFVRSFEHLPVASK